MERSSFGRTGPTEKSRPPRKVDKFFRNFSGWTEPIHSVLDRNFRKFWLNGSRPRFMGQTSCIILGLECHVLDMRNGNNVINIFFSLVKT